MEYTAIDVAERIKTIGRNMDRGQDTYAGRLGAWHKRGAVIGRFATWQEINTAGGGDFEVVKLQLEHAGVPVESYGTFRKNADGTLRFYGNVGKDYGIIPHQVGFAGLDALVGSIDGAHYETMGVLDYGRIVWGQVDPQVSIRVGDDVSDVLLTFMTSHDGTKAAEFFQTVYRAVCRNTLRAASLKRLGQSMRVRHTSKGAARIKDFATELAEFKTEAATVEEKLNFLASRRITKDGLESIMDRLFPKTEDAETGEMRSPTRRNNILSEVLSLYESNDGDAFPVQRGSAYNLLNAITNFADHKRGGDEAKREESAMLGTGAKLKSDALRMILDEAEGLPELVRVGVSQGIGHDVVAEMLGV